MRDSAVSFSNVITVPKLFRKRSHDFMTGEENHRAVGLYTGNEQMADILMSQ